MMKGRIAEFSGCQWLRHPLLLILSFFTAWAAQGETSCLSPEQIDKIKSEMACDGALGALSCSGVFAGTGYSAAGGYAALRAKIQSELTIEETKRLRAEQIRPSINMKAFREQFRLSELKELQVKYVSLEKWQRRSLMLKELLSMPSRDKGIPERLGGWSDRKIQSWLNRHQSGKISEKELLRLVEARMKENMATLEEDISAIKHKSRKTLEDVETRAKKDKDDWIERRKLLNHKHRQALRELKSLLHVAKANYHMAGKLTALGIAGTMLEKGVKYTGDQAIGCSDEIRNNPLICVDNYCRPQLGFCASALAFLQQEPQLQEEAFKNEAVCEYFKAAYRSLQEVQPERLTSAQCLGGTGFEYQGQTSSGERVIYRASYDSKGRVKSVAVNSVDNKNDYKLYFTEKMRLNQVQVPGQLTGDQAAPVTIDRVLETLSPDEPDVVDQVLSQRMSDDYKKKFTYAIQGFGRIKRTLPAVWNCCASHEGQSQCLDGLLDQRDLGKQQEPHNSEGLLQ